MSKQTELGSLPVEVVMKFFARSKDVALLNLAQTCVKFSGIAASVFSDRYANQYFQINGEHDAEIYKQISGQFGKLKAVQVRNVEGFNANHWSKSQINHGNLTHLSFQNVYSTEENFALPLEIFLLLNYSKFIVKNDLYTQILHEKCIIKCIQYSKTCIFLNILCRFFMHFSLQMPTYYWCNR